MPKKSFHILVINPGSTSTKIAVYRDDKLIHQADVQHPPSAGSIWDEFDNRLVQIRAMLKDLSLDTPIDAVAGRGGLLKPIEGGTYTVNEAMLADARANLQGEHAANLGCAFADALARELNAPAFVVDPVSVDEFEPLARYSGHPDIRRRALAHTLNMHAVARAAAAKLKIPYKKSSFVVAHLGGGVSISPLKGGRIIDANDASSNGPFTPERTGTLPLQPFIKMCFSGKYTESDMRKLVMGKGGLVAYLGTNDMREIERRITEGDSYAAEVVQAMCYQIAKEIGAMATVLFGKVHAILMTGGLTHSRLIYKSVKKRVSWIAPVMNFAGEHEMLALALGTLRVLRGEERPRTY
ncbi:MAG: butyrate kinase [Bacteroidota bacterium]|nr:butyrate kinase [Bacteroidota bacterium]